MHKIALSLAALGLATTAAFAQTPTTFADVDADASGELSFVELKVVWADLSEAEFGTADVDGSGGLNVTELNSLQPAAVPTPVPVPDGAIEMVPAPQ